MRGLPAPSIAAQPVPVLAKHRESGRLHCFDEDILDSGCENHYIWDYEGTNTIVPVPNNRSYFEDNDLCQHLMVKRRQ